MSQGLTESQSTWNEELLVDDGRASLRTQIAWFNKLRFGAVAGIVVMTVGGNLFGLLAHPLPLYALAAVTLAVNLVYLSARRRLRSYSAKRLRRHVDLQIGVDLTILTVILHFSGGVTNPLVLFYLFHTFIAAFLLSLRAAIVVAALSMALMTALGIGELFGWISHYPLAVKLLDLELLGATGVLLWLGSLALLLFISIYFVATILRQLADREAALVGFSRQLAQSEKLASIGTLAAGVSHEINNPVGVIQHKTEILRYRIQDGDSSELLLAELNAIEHHTRRIGAITEGLLAFARETPFELRPLAVNRLAREGADLVRVPFESAEVELRLELCGDEPRIDGSPNHLLQVFVNVLLNARDASPRGSVVTMTTGSADGQVWVRIEDQGEGIGPEILDKIFDPFFTTKDVDRGTGLGLALSHSIVERHLGRIEVESVVGKGSVFRIVVPTGGS
jgi:signal transduction histidine kinase